MSLPIGVARDLNRGWAIYLYEQVYFGPESAGRIVPNPKDLIFRVSGNVLQQFQVLAVDESTFLPTLLPLKEGGAGQAVEAADILLAPTTQTYRLMYNDSVTPHVIRPDGRCYLRVADAAYCRLYKGRTIDASGQVISAYYSTNGEYVGPNIPLSTMEDSAEGSVYKGVQKGWTSEELEDGEIVTLVFHSSDGLPLSFQDLIVLKTNFIPTADQTTKAVRAISLESQFLTNGNSGVINYPLNLPLTALNLVGVVHYVDNTSTRMTVDGTRFSVSGLEAFAPTRIGRTTEIVLRYKLQTNEVAYGASSSPDRQFSSTYTLVTVASNDSYAVSLYCFPEWVSAQAGYRLRWFMLDLDRSVNYDVTGLVDVEASTPFNSLQYGQIQRMSVSLRLKSVSPTYNDFVHVQICEVLLNAAGTNRPPRNGLANYQVSHSAGDRPLFGNGVYATFSSTTQTNAFVDVSGDATTVEEWLQMWYRANRPQFNPETETGAPDPTHFRLTFSGTEATFPISSWNQTIPIQQALTSNSTMHVTFIRRTTDADLILARAAAPLWKIDSLGAYV